jgi:hypothetical protein
MVHLLLKLRLVDSIHNGIIPSLDMHYAVLVDILAHHPRRLTPLDLFIGMKRYLPNSHIA